ncbi:unnamed protein product [Pocillopora meandrina]|uniref:Peroxisomal 2,4-dienoyl-CoA reductase [(3E)-enoyl-CoA-producing] n=1 Tax=Pocillopora meandrina TaxID=46732 RepID=A0AAU9VVV7_9CNID|nr:unnamed protein product [Pocillopora meandrina]
MYCFSNGAFLFNIFILQLPGDEDLQFLQIGLLALFIRMLLGNCVDQCHTGSTKPAIEGMSRHLAVEWGPDGIRVNCVAPGAVKDTEGFCRQV